MSLELAEAALGATDLVLLGDVLPASIAAGAIAGIACSDPKYAAAFGLAGGAVVSVLGKGKTTPEKMAMSMATSTAVGLIVNYVKNCIQSKKDPENAARDASCGCSR